MSTVTDPSATRSGANTPFSVAWATTAKTSTTNAARRFPPPVSTVSREMQPRVRTMPAPKSNPPMAIARNGTSDAIKRCASKLIQPAATAACVPITASASAVSQTPSA